MSKPLQFVCYLILAYIIGIIIGILLTNLNIF